jgi:hypothetical protein
MMLTFDDRDYSTLKQRAKEEQRPIATYARLLILRQLASATSR